MAILGSSLLNTLITSLIAFIGGKTGIVKAVQLILLDTVKRSGKEHLLQGNITMEELKEFNEKYEAYKALKGNGYAETIHKKVNSLPIVEE